MRGAAILALALSACEPALEDDAAEPLDPNGSGLPVRVVALLDTAAQAFTAGDAQSASRLYRTVIVGVPDLAAAWFGLYLAERTLGHTAAADSALARARQAARADASTAPPRS